MYPCLAAERHGHEQDLTVFAKKSSHILCQPVKYHNVFEDPLFSTTITQQCVCFTTETALMLAMGAKKRTSVLHGVARCQRLRVLIESLPPYTQLPIDTCGPKCVRYVFVCLF